jgi:2-dehydro-3-deoxyphosphogluconate aldolase/(4S)-4-hydroxy-2-oxoglutarate aldolase
MDVAFFKNNPLLGILRGVDADCIEPLVETIAASGLETIEITMNTANASELIRKAKQAARGRLAIGAGTVLTMGSLKNALDSGASFIVTPVLVEDVVG